MAPERSLELSGDPESQKVRRGLFISCPVSAGKVEPRYQSIQNPGYHPHAHSALLCPDLPTSVVKDCLAAPLVRRSQGPQRYSSYSHTTKANVHARGSHLSSFQNK